MSLHVNETYVFHSKDTTTHTLRICQTVAELFRKCWRFCVVCLIFCCYSHFVSWKRLFSYIRIQTSHIWLTFPVYGRENFLSRSHGFQYMVNICKCRSNRYFCVRIIMFNGCRVSRLTVLFHIFHHFWFNFCYCYCYCCCCCCWMLLCYSAKLYMVLWHNANCEPAPTHSKTAIFRMVPTMQT